MSLPPPVQAFNSLFPNHHLYQLIPYGVRQIP